MPSISLHAYSCSIPRRSNRESEGRITQQHPLPPIGLLVTLAEVEGHDSDDADDEDITSHARGESRHIVRSVFSPEDQRSRDTSNSYRESATIVPSQDLARLTADASQAGGAKRSPPLSSDIVCLVGHDSRNGRIGSRDRDEYTDILRPWICSEPHNGYADQRYDAQEAKNRTSCSILVAVPGSTIHQNARCGIRRRA